MFFGILHYFYLYSNLMVKGIIEMYLSLMVTLIHIKCLDVISIPKLPAG